MLNDFDVFDLTVFVDALYDAINQEEWWNQEVTHDSITLTVLRVERRRPTEFFTVFFQFVSLSTTSTLYHLHVIIMSSHKPTAYQSIFIGDSAVLLTQHCIDNKR